MITAILDYTRDTYEILRDCVYSIFRFRVSKNEVIRQAYEFGYSSLGIVAICVTFMGVIIILEYSYHMKLVISNDSMIPGFAMNLLTRELAPIVTALLLTSKQGAAISAELSAMKNTEQLDAYRLLGLNVVELFVAPKVIASALCSAALAMISLFIATIGALFAAATFLNFPMGNFFLSLFNFAHAPDFMLMVVKSLVFGAVIPVISAVHGLRSKFGAEGVGHATTDAVVSNSISIIILDFLITYLFSIWVV